MTSLERQGAWLCERYITVGKHATGSVGRSVGRLVGRSVGRSVHRLEA